MYDSFLGVLVVSVDFHDPESYVSRNISLETSQFMYDSFLGVLFESVDFHDPENYVSKNFSFC